MKSTTQPPNLAIHAVEDLDTNADLPPADLLEVADEPALAELLRAEGWRVGLPATVTPETFVRDAHAHQRHACPACSCRKMVATPYHRQCRYRVVLTCRCGGEVEV